jgi:hypothetical protein
MIMAKAYPNSTFYGFDYHAPSVESARKQAEKEAVTEDRDLKQGLNIGKKEDHSRIRIRWSNYCI